MSGVEEVRAAFAVYRKLEEVIERGLPGGSRIWLGIALFSVCFTLNYYVHVNFYSRFCFDCFGSFNVDMWRSCWTDLTGGPWRQHCRPQSRSSEGERSGQLTEPCTAWLDVPWESGGLADRPSSSRRKLDLHKIFFSHENSSDNNGYYIWFYFYFQLNRISYLSTLQPLYKIGHQRFIFIFQGQCSQPLLPIWTCCNLLW